MAVWIGIDVGGTFTDFVAYDDNSGISHTYKAPSTPHNPGEAIVNGLRTMTCEQGISPDAISQLAHGTTVGTNTLIQRKGGRVALLVTRGFRDLLEIGRQTRPLHFDMYADHPPPVVPRPRRFEVEERVVSNGAVRTALDDAEIERALAEVREAGVEAGVEAIAVCFLFSYLTPEHEQRVGRALAAAFPDAYVSLSCEVQPEFREYERLSTTVLNAYLQPSVARYIERLGAEMGEELPQTEVVISQSSGGLMSLEKARAFPIRTALSGPAAGVLGAIEVMRRAGGGDMITFDMGGTSADVSLVRDLEPGQSYSRHIGGYPVRLPSVDINTVGAGGGSIAWFDRDDLLKVGPVSAGAAPGPACYGGGGEEATVTDANLILGRLSPGGLLGGAMNLDEAAARRVMEPVAKRLGFTVEHAAHGILEIVVSNMCRAIRAISVECGHDPRQLALVAFGGAGPLHARAVAASLEMRRIVVPPAPGILCAAGLNASDLKEDFVRTAQVVVDGVESLARVAEIGESLERRAREWFDDESILADQRRLRLSLDMRYVGQNFELSVPLTPVPVFDMPQLPSTEHLLELFFAAHERNYGYHNASDPVEVVNCRLTASGRKHTAPVAATQPAHEGAVEPIATRDVWFTPTEPSSTPVYERSHLNSGHTLSGPAVIEQMDSTTLVFPGDRLSVDDAGNLIIEVAP
jgi:N-methylhydantoinase A